MRPQSIARALAEYVEELEAEALFRSRIGGHTPALTAAISALARIRDALQLFEAGCATAAARLPTECQLAADFGRELVASGLFDPDCEHLAWTREAISLADALADALEPLPAARRPLKGYRLHREAFPYCQTPQAE